MIEFELKDSYIELNKLLKYLQLCESGAVANICITDGLVSLNGAEETRKRAKIRKGDFVEFEGNIIKVI
jgi:ribosome-associated protein